MKTTSTELPLHRPKVPARLRRAALVAAFAVGLISLRSTAAELRLVPQPRDVRASAEAFAVDPQTPLVTLGGAAEDRWAADSLNEELRTAGFTLPIATATSVPAQAIVLGRLTDPGIQARLKQLGIEAREVAAEGYVLHVGADQVLVAGADASGLYYGVQTLRQLFAGENGRGTFAGVTILDWPSLRYRGMQVDLARGPVPTLAYMKRIIATAAEFKLNQVVLYMEDSFQPADEPLIGVLSDEFTMHEWREVVAFGREHHVEIVPAQEFSGHLRKILRFERYSDMGERPHGNVLAPDNPQTLAFVDKMASALTAVFPSKLYVIGFDETFELGRGQTAERVRDEGFAAVYAKFLTHVHDVFAAKGKTVVFWGDMMMRHPEKLGMLPKDMIAQPWAYFPEKTYAAWLDPFVKNGFKILPESWVGGSGNLIIHDYQQAAKNIAHLTDESRTAGALGMCNTIWGDNGAALFAPNWWSIVYGAACDWEPTSPAVAQFNAKYDWVFYRNTDQRLTDAIWQVAGINETIVARGVGGSWGLKDFGGTQADLFWRDPFSREGRQEIEKVLPVARKVRLDAETAYTVLTCNTARAKRNADTLAYYRFVALQLDALAMRWQYLDEISHRYADAYAHRDAPSLYKFDMYEITGTNGRLQDLRDYTTRLRQLYADVFLSESRATWLPNVLQLYDRQSAQWQDKIALFEEITRDFKSRRPIPAPDSLGLLTVAPDRPIAPLLTNEKIPATQPPAQ